MNSKYINLVTLLHFALHIKQLKIQFTKREKLKYFQPNVSLIESEKKRIGNFLFFTVKCTSEFTKMICLETKHFRLNRFLLLAIGLWPHQRSKLAQIQFIVLFTILTTFVVFQVIISFSYETIINRLEFETYKSH